MRNSTATRSAGNPGSAFDSFACHYDAFTDHPAYPGWIRRLEGLARAHGVAGRRALDVGCGTGKSILPLLDLGYDVVGCDPSSEMLAEAARKVDGQAKLVRAPAEALPRLGGFDYISCLNDVCNYIGAPERLTLAFRSIAANLADEGLLVFDVNTAATYRGWFSQTHWRETPTVKMVWHGPNPEDFAPNETTEATVEIFERDQGGLWRHETTRHVQHHYDEQTIAELLTPAGLRVAALYGQTDAGPPEQPLEPDRHTKALYVVKHKAHFDE